VKIKKGQTFAEVDRERELCFFFFFLPLLFFRSFANGYGSDPIKVSLPQTKLQY
jgi:hypothetical protein